LGIWEAEVTLVPSGNTQSFSFLPRVFKVDGNGTRYIETSGTTPTNITYDITLPQATAITRTTNLIDIDTNQNKTIPGWTPSDANVTYSLTSDKPLWFSQLQKEDAFIQIFSGTTPTTWSGDITVNRNTEGFYYPKLFLYDYAGNISMYDSTLDFQTLDFRLFIDNTTAVYKSANWNTWGYREGGKGAGNGKTDVYIGRLNTGYVTRAKTITLTGKAEKGQRVKVYTNGKYYGMISVPDTNCKVEESISGISTDKVTADNLTVYSAMMCEVSFDYTFTSNGSNASGGEPTDGVFFEMKQLDSAGNISNTSTPLFVYYDTQAPVSPEIIINNDDIFVKGERFADNEILMYAPDGTMTSSGTVRADKYGYTQTGVHTVFKDLWGIYTIGVRSYDASGNISVSTKILERIKPTPTPEPTKEPVYEEVTTSGGTTYYTTGQVKGTKTVYTTQTINQTVTKTVTKTVTEQVKKPCDWSFNIFDSNNCVNVWATGMWQTITKTVSETVTQVVQKTVQVAQEVTTGFIEGTKSSVNGIVESTKQLGGSFIQGATDLLINTGITLAKAAVGATNLVGNFGSAIAAGIESTYNGKNFSDNYNSINQSGDWKENAINTAAGVAVIAAPLVIAGAVVAAAPVIVSAAAVAGIPLAIGTAATIATVGIGTLIVGGSMAYGVYQKASNNVPLSTAINEIVCGKVDPTALNCIGYVGGQLTATIALSKLTESAYKMVGINVPTINSGATTEGVTSTKPLPKVVEEVGTVKTTAPETNPIIRPKLNTTEINKIADDISNGHAYTKHALNPNENATIPSKEQFKAEAIRIMNNPDDVKYGNNGRIAFWDEKTKSILIYNPNGVDKSTMFKPEPGKSYFYNEFN